MKQSTIQPLIIRLRICIVAFVLVILSLFLFSFTSQRLAEDFLQQLGIAKNEANDKIVNSILGGYLDQYGVKNAKNIAVGNRAAVVKDLLNYTKQQVNSPAFVKEYTAMKERNKPQSYNIEAPDEMRRKLIEQYRKSVEETEANMKKADPSIKKFFEDALVQSKKALKDAEDPNNKMLANYAKNYEGMVKSAEASNKQQVADWEAKYPSNHLLFVKKRLQQFLDETSNIDFSAELVEKNGRKYFVKQEYEHKGNRWKLAYRAGREVIEPARAFVQQWINEIK